MEALSVSAVTHSKKKEAFMRAGTMLAGPQSDPLMQVTIEREKRRGLPTDVYRHPFQNDLHQLTGPLPGRDSGRVETLREIHDHFDD